MQAVELVERDGRVVPLECVRAQRAAQAAHQRGRGQALAGHVAHHQPDPPAGHRDHVVPVAPHLGLRGGGQVAGGHREPGQLREAVGQQAPLERLGDPVLALVDPGAVDPERHAIGGQPEQGQVVRGEPARGGGEHQQHPGHACRRRAGAPPPASRLRVADGSRGRPAGRPGSSIGSRAAATRPANPSPKRRRVGLAAVRGAGGRAQRQPLVLGQVDRGSVRSQHAPDPGHQVGQDGVGGAVGQRRVHHELHAADHLGHALGLRPRGLFAQEHLALLLAAPALGEVADERGHHHVVPHGQARGWSPPRGTPCRPCAAGPPRAA